MIERELSKKLLKSIEKYQVISLSGPRQSGKTTLLKSIFPNFKYISLELPNERTFVQEDPLKFLNQFKNGLILDEAQKVPEIFSYIQTIVDNNRNYGPYILSGSENFLLSERISQSLAGRVRIFKLLPFSLLELQNTEYFIDNTDKFLFKGMYPRIYDRKLNPNSWLQDYIETYVERDVRNIKNISNISLFQKFIKLAAGRTGQILNFNELANNCGVTHNTAKSWLRILEASYIIFTLNPYYKNFNKRIMKQPKLYFYDTGLACSLLGINSTEQLNTYYLRGGLFESFIISEYVKYRFNLGLKNNSYYWRDRYGHEIDLLIENGNNLYPIEIKSGQSINNDYFKNIKWWSEISGVSPEFASIIYAGDDQQERKYGKIYSWKNIEKLFGSFI